MLKNQSSWPIARKELVAAVNSVKLMNHAVTALKIDSCRKLWCDSRTVLQWILNPDLRLKKFIARRVNNILLLSDASEWHYCPTQLNAADVGSRPKLILKASSRDLWLNGPSLLYQTAEFPNVREDVSIQVHTVNVEVEAEGKSGLERMIESSCAFMC